MTSFRQIFLKHGTDKATGHNYGYHYEFHLDKYRHQKFSLLEIGVGGYDSPLVGGASLRAWKEIFAFAEIYSVDIYDKSALEEDRIHIFRGSQDNQSFMLDCVRQMRYPLKVIIDDGSHLVAHQKLSFDILWPYLEPGGIYIVEDTQTSYWPEFRIGQDSDFIDFTCEKIDRLNFKEWLLDKPLEPTGQDLTIESVHCYHNLVMFCKGDNSEESNIVVNNKKG